MSKHHKKEYDTEISRDNLLDLKLKDKGLIFIFAGLSLLLFYKILFEPPVSPDFVSQFFPNSVYWKAYFLKHFSLAFWQPYINAGTPDLDTGAFFPFINIITTYIFPSDLGPGIGYMFIIFLSGLFSFIYFKSLKMSRYSAFVASLIYMLCGDIISYFYPGHLGKPLVMALLPLSLFFIDQAFASGKKYYFIFAGLALGQSYLSHPQIFYYSVIFQSCYYAYRVFLRFKETRNIKEMIYPALGYGLMGIFAFLYASPGLLNQLFYQKMTSRGTLESREAMWQFATSWSHHPLELLTFFIPSLFGLYNQTYLGWKPFVMTTDYLGAITMVLAVIGIILNWKKRGIKFFFFALVIMILFSFGRHFPAFYKLFFNYFPHIKKFRVPSSIFLIASFIIVLFAFYGLQDLLKARDDKRVRDKIFYILIGFGIFFLVLSLWISSSGFEDLLKENLAFRGVNVKAIIQQYGLQGEQFLKNQIQPTVEMARNGMKLMWLWFVLFAGLWWMFSSGRLRLKPFKIILVVLILLDLYLVDNKFINTTDNYDIIEKETDAIKYLKKDQEKFRILPLLSSNEANKWQLFGIESVSGYHAIGLKIYEDVQREGLFQNLRFLGLLNTKYILSTKPMNIDGVTLVYTSKENRYIYLNQHVLPRYFLVDRYIVEKKPENILVRLKDPGFDYRRQIMLEEDPFPERPVDLSMKNNIVLNIKWTPDEMVFKCRIKNPCFLFLSEIYYPKWEAFIKDKKIKIYKTDYLFRSVLLPVGEYTLTFRFRNNYVYLVTAFIHYALSLGCLAVCFLAIKKKRSEAKKTAS